MELDQNPGKEGNFSVLQIVKTVDLFEVKFPLKKYHCPTLLTTYGLVDKAITRN